MQVGFEGGRRSALSQSRNSDTARSGHSGKIGESSMRPVRCRTQATTWRLQWL